MKDKLDHKKNQWNAVFLDAKVIPTTWETVSTNKVKWLQISKAVGYKKFLIKISDLLNETGKSDEISFENKFVEQLPNVTKEGISWSFTIQSVDGASLLGTLHNIHCKLQDTCDSCGKSFIRDIEIPEYTARFVLEDSITPEEKEAAEEAILFIDSNSETIDIQDMITQAIILNEPFVKRCPPCEKKLEKEEDEGDDLWAFESKWNISFS